MKKFICIFTATLLTVTMLTSCGNKNTVASFSSAASQSQTSEDNQNRTVVLDNVGLTYTTPDEWRQIEKTNLYPLTLQTDGTLARIIYTYVKADDIDKIQNINDDSSVYKYLYPICEITIAKSENFTNDSLKSVFDVYKNDKSVATEGDYSYHVLYDYVSKDNLDGDDLDKYNKAVEAVPELIKSISTRKFNPDDVKKTVDTSDISNNYITFNTKTIEGNPIDSSVFAKYDITMINFWGTYAIDKSNEQNTLEEVYENVQTWDKKVNVINAIVDTPNDENEATVKDLKSEANGKFTTIVMDDILANWAVKHLEGVPTTIFVDSDGKIIGDQIKGAKTTQEYLDELKARLSEIDKASK
ncbi:MAG: hypothetical protein LKJ25_10410 [Clostridia bacterium]|nr:hypothetical protein [Clostridia bacterium]